MRHLLLSDKPDGLVLDQQGDAASHTAGRMPGAGRVDDEATRRIGAMLVEFVARQDEHMFIADVCVLGYSCAGLVTQQHRGWAAVAVVV